jgi:MYXO-CTERM domain-containing protein
MKRLFLLFVAVVSLASVAKSELVLDNITNNSGSEEYLGGTFWRAQSFVTSTGDWTLNNVVLRFRFNGGNILAYIYSDSGSNLPGSSLETLTGPTSNSGATPTNATYTSTGLSLTGNTRYWIVVTENQTGELGWTTAANTSTTGSWSIPGTNISATSVNSGSSWTANSAIQNFSINATASAPAPVPEPGTWAAAALLAGGAAFARWRRRRESK